MDIYINILAKQILAQANVALPKVRFAKIIYFTFKQLLILDKEDSQQLAFIRMPLGPVADGFMDLINDPEISVVHDNVGLSYNREKYSLTRKIKKEYRESSMGLAEVMKKLNKVSTSDLVAASHQDPSWISHVNGSVYHITQEDLKMPFPIYHEILDKKIDDQLIQSQLVSGMIDDVVTDSSALEHPDYYKNG